MWRVEAYTGGQSVALFFVPAVGRGYATRWTTDQLCKLGESLVPVTTAIAVTTTAEWVKTARHTEREATLGSGGIQATEVESSAAPTVLAPGQGAPLVDPAAWPIPSTSSANVDRVP
jgi:hypothetical protein